MVAGTAVYDRPLIFRSSSLRLDRDTLSLLRRMGCRGVSKTWRLAAALLAIAGCGGTSGLRPDAAGGGAGGSGGGGGNGGNGATGGSGAATTGGVDIAREFSVQLDRQREVDVLFLVDDSSLMLAAQATLRLGFARFMAALRAVPGGLPNLHIAVISSDMGAGDGSISGCSSTGGKNGVFQYMPRGTCTSTGLQTGATYISDAGSVKNYTGNIEDVFGCIAALGETGCGFEQPFAAITRALGADGRAAPAQNQGFLRPNAYLAVVLLTNEDDCSVLPGVPLFDVSSNTNIASQLGPPSNFRCNEFGHSCNGMRPSRNAPNNDVAAMVTYNDCTSSEGEGYLLSVVDTASRIKALKADPGQVFFAAITGPATPYTVTWKAPSGADTSCGAASCPWPSIAHSCTAANGSFADPAVRTNLLAAQFGDNGFASSICDADFGPALERLATKLGAAIAGRCISEPIADDTSRAGYQPRCTAELYASNGSGSYTSQSLPACADNGGAAPCWSLATDAAGCQRPEVRLAAPPTGAANARYECTVCASGVVGVGCDGAGANASSLSTAPIFGAPCDLGVSLGQGPGAVSVIRAPAPGCASGVCLLPGIQKDPRDTGPLCTTSCTTDDDCLGGMMGPRFDALDHRCETGFACMVPTTVGDLCCKRMCVCRDFLAEPIGGFQTPPSCMPGAASGCANVR
jgi:hypothetical protein